MIDNGTKNGTIGIFLICLVGMLWFYSKGYENSIGWEVTSAAEIIEYPGVEIKGQLMEFEVTGEKYLLTESYSGGPITRHRRVDAILTSMAWLGVCISLVGASFLKRYGFIAALALFALLINRLNLGEIGLFEIHSKWALGIPFIGIATPLFFFHEYRPKTNFLVRLISIVLISALIVMFGINRSPVFLDHFISHSQFSFAIAGLLFLLIIAEENIFAVLFLATQGKGGKSNHVHVVCLSIIYLANLILYYLNKSGYLPNSFSLFDPFVLLFISCLIALWSLKFKAKSLGKYVPGESFFSISIGLGIILLSLLNLAFFQGNDAIYESFHYFILYFHIGFGVFFLLYLILNFIDPLRQGVEVFKIAYKEQHFPYVSARLGGFAVVLGFYFLATQEPYNLLKSGYYANLGNLEETLGNRKLANQYYQHASFLGLNTHHSNYQLAWNYSDEGNEYLTKAYFEKATSRYPSPFAFLNYASLDMGVNPVKAQASLALAAQRFDDGEIKNNLGVLSMQHEEWEKAFEQFKHAKSSNTWNQAPLLNKWTVYRKINQLDSSSYQEDYDYGNFGVKTNILATTDSGIFEIEGLLKAPMLHRQAYLLNSAPIFSDDTLTWFALNEIENSPDAKFANRLRKALVIHYYKKGNVNNAFHMLDYLQANAYEHQKGVLLTDLGKLALDQGAYQLSLDFFDRATKNGHVSAEVSRLEALGYLGRSDEIHGRLLEIVKKDPSLTKLANQILANLKRAKFMIKKDNPSLHLSSYSNAELIELAGKNAFNEQVVVEAVEILNKREVPRAYDIILESIEINPHAVNLMKAYAFTALDQNLASYADAVLPRIMALSNAEEYQKFISDFNSRKKTIESQSW